MFKDKYEYYDYCISKLYPFGISCEAYAEIQYGIQFSVASSNRSGLVRIYESKKGTRVDLSQVKDVGFQEELSKLLLSEELIEIVEIPGEIQLPISISLTSTSLYEIVEKFLIDFGAFKVDVTTEYMRSCYSIDKNRITVFKSGKLLIQGKSTEKIDNLYYQLVDKIKDSNDFNFINEAIDYLEDEIDISNFKQKAEIQKMDTSAIEKYVSSEFFNYLEINDQNDLLDGVSLFELCKEQGDIFNNYAIVVRNFAIVFEGFLIKIFIESGILIESEYATNVNSAIGAKLINNKILEFIDLPARNKGIATRLQSVWENHRNKNMHSDYMAYKKIDTLIDAERSIYEILGAMQECFKLLDFEKMFMLRFGDDNKETKLLDVADMDYALNILVKKKFSIKPQKNAFWMAEKNDCLIININNKQLKIIGHKRIIEEITKAFENSKEMLSDLIENSIIGVDESGKGDYFGPLVIAGVHADESKKRILENLGVMDSKKISDSRISMLANEIKKICKYNIVVINNEKYNQLYEDMKNLNILLAWGHARVIENLLNEVECGIALSDQFGKTELIENALMDKGKKIKLEQRPKAETNVVVAAASILARDAFVKQLLVISRQYNLEFPKGASLKIIEIGKQIVKVHGEEELKKVGKLHFKTTQDIIK